MGVELGGRGGVDGDEVGSFVGFWGVWFSGVEDSVGPGDEAGAHAG